MVGRGGVGSLRFGGASFCWERIVTFHSHRSVGPPRSVGSTCLGGSSCMVKITPNAPNLDHAKK